MDNKFYKFINTSKYRFCLMMTIFVFLTIISLIVNFLITDNERKNYGSLELWSLFLFTVTSLWMLKFWKKEKKIIWIKLFLLTILTLFITIIIIFPIFNLAINFALYTAIGIIFFCLSWSVEMYLFWFLGV